jgi:hypothetical protein
VSSDTLGLLILADVALVVVAVLLWVWWRWSRRGHRRGDLRPDDRLGGDGLARGVRALPWRAVSGETWPMVGWAVAALAGVLLVVWIWRGGGPDDPEPPE